MKIIINEKDKSIVLENNGLKKTITFEEIKQSQSWILSNVIMLEDGAINERGSKVQHFLNREAFTANMLYGDEEYMKYRGAYDLNTAIHKLYALLDGKTVEEAESEIANLCQQRKALDAEKKEWGDAQVDKIKELEERAKQSSDAVEFESIVQEIEAVKKEEPPFLVSREMKKLLYAANDAECPDINLSNVSREVVLDHYGDNLNVV